jgi:hypothetical protein
MSTIVRGLNCGGIVNPLRRSRVRRPVTTVSIVSTSA